MFRCSVYDVRHIRCPLFPFVSAGCKLGYKKFYIKVKELQFMTEAKVALRKALSLPELVVIGVVGAVGTGALFSTAQMTAVAGPGSVLSWIIGALFYTCVGVTYVELSQVYPEAGGPSRYSLYTHGRATNMIGAFSDLIWYLFIPPIEALAVVEGINYFVPTLIGSNGFPTYAGAALGVLFMFVFIPFNYFGVKAFGKSTFWIGIAKIILYCAVGFGLILVFFNARNFVGYGGFAPFGFSGVFVAIPLAMFAYGGIRALPDFAEEVRNYRFLGAAIGLAILGQTLVYILFDTSFVGGINWARLGITAGQWSSVTVPGNPFIYLAGKYNVESLLIITAIVGIIGPFVTGYIYQGAGTRILFAMSRSRIMNSSLKTLSQSYAIPYWSLIAFAIVGAIVAFLAAPLPSIYSLITDAVVAGYIGFSVNPVSMMVSRRQGVTKSRFPAGNIIAPIGFIAASLIVYWSGWPSVPYSVLILLVATVIFSVAFKVKQHFVNSLWYIVYIAFLTAMSYIGSVGALNTISFLDSSLIVALVSVIVFYPWGIFSGLKQRLTIEGVTAEPVTQ